MTRRSYRRVGSDDLHPPPVLVPALNRIRISLSTQLFHSRSQLDSVGRLTNNKSAETSRNVSNITQNITIIDVDCISICWHCCIGLILVFVWFGCNFLFVWLIQSSFASFVPFRPNLSADQPSLITQFDERLNQPIHFRPPWRAIRRRRVGPYRISDFNMFTLIRDFRSDQQCSVARKGHQRREGRNRERKEDYRQITMQVG